MSDIFTLANLLAFLTLTALEIVLGIDNIVFIVVIVARLPKAVQAKARRIGLALAMLTRIGLLLCITLILRLTEPLLTLGGHAVSGRDLVLLLGGLFLLAKATMEIHAKLEKDEGGESGKVKASAGYLAAVLQIAVLDIVFSLDSVITAVGMVQEVWIMVAAIVAAVGVMLFFAGPVGDFVNRHPTVQMLAFSFLLLVGVLLVAEGFGKHIDRGYVYFAMGFSLFVELLNIRSRKPKPAPAP
jgi:predicted tellurium resistance membrane protein TerC